MPKVKLEFQNGEEVARIILDDGKGNILDHVMMEELQDLLNSKLNI